MSKQYPGGIISKTAPTPSGPYSTDTAPGIWTLEQQAYWQKLGQWPTAGNVNSSAFIENLFSTYLYTGNGSVQSIPNGINLGPNTGNSNYFNAGQINTNSSTSAFDLGTSDWTVECWIKTSYTSRIDPFELNGGTSSGFFGLTLNSSASGYIEWNESSGGSSVAVITATGTTVANDSWHNIAVTRSGNSVRLFFDGTQVGSTYTTSYTYGGASKAFRFGNRYPGGISSSSVFYISNFRIVKGTALYTTTFTPSTQPLTQISGTSYLGAQSLSSLEDTTLIGNSYTNNVTPNGIGPFSYGTGSGGLVWAKARSSADNHGLYDTARGVENRLISNSTAAQSTASGVTAFNTNGFSLGSNSDVNGSGKTTVSWTFRKQAKFFDVVTGTGSGTFNHNLQSVPGCIILKRTDGASSWFVRHNGLTGGITGTYDVTLNTTAAQSDSGVSFNPTSTQFTVPAGYISAGETWVAYLFAHDAGGFGLTGTDNVISCGSFTTDGSGLASVTLGYEPQWMLLKASTAAESWNVTDTMRGWTQSGTNDIRYLQPNTSGAEGSASNNWEPNATGFSVIGGLSSSTTYIYIAIRRGPMQVPTSGASVFTPLSYTNSTGGVTISSLTYPADLVITDRKNTASHRAVWDRLRGATKAIYTNLTNAEGNVGDGLSSFASNVGYTTGSGGAADNTVDGSQINWVFQRAPSFFDEVCYTGTGSATTVTHNLGAVPELMIVKARNSSSYDWGVYSATTGASNVLKLNLTDASTANSFYFNGTTPTASVFSLGTSAATNGSGNTYVAYLFATCAGVSKVGSYTGTATTLQVNCGFTAGARFVMIKRTDSTGDWYVWDSARGIVAGNDPYLLLNSSAAEVTGTDYVDTYSAGFEISSTAPAAINASGGTFIFLAIA